MVTEAARAINDDGGIEGALPALAALLEHTPFENEALIRRVISANLREGSAESAHRLARYALRDEAPESMRADAISALGVLPAPSVLDRVDGMHLGSVYRDSSAARGAMTGIVDSLLMDDAVAVRQAVAGAVGHLRIGEAAASMMQVLEADPEVAVRQGAIDALLSLTGVDSMAVIAPALQDVNAEVRMHALQHIPESGFRTDRITDLLTTVLHAGTAMEQQSVLARLKESSSPRWNAVLSGMLDQLEAGGVNPEIHLDLLEAAEAAGEPLRARAEAWRASATPFIAALYGGNPRRGQRIVITHQAAECMRCHPFMGDDGVGPPLAGMGSRLSRQQLLESLVDPSGRIAPGFGTPDIPSAMPDMSSVLSEREIRDVVAFMANLR